MWAPLARVSSPGLVQVPRSSCGHHWLGSPLQASCKHRGLLVGTTGFGLLSRPRASTEVFMWAPLAWVSSPGLVQVQRSSCGATLARVSSPGLVQVPRFCRVVSQAMDRASSPGLLVSGETNRALATVSEYYYQHYSSQERREILSLHNLVLILPEKGATSHKFLLMDGVYFFPEKGIWSLTCSLPCHQYCRQAVRRSR